MISGLYDTPTRSASGTMVALCGLSRIRASVRPIGRVAVQVSVPVGLYNLCLTIQVNYDCLTRARSARLFCTCLIDPCRHTLERQILLGQQSYNKATTKLQQSARELSDNSG